MFFQYIKIELRNANCIRCSHYIPIIPFRPHAAVFRSVVISHSSEWPCLWKGTDGTEADLHLRLCLVTVQFLCGYTRWSHGSQVQFVAPVTHLTSSRPSKVESEHCIWFAAGSRTSRSRWICEFNLTNVCFWKSCSIYSWIGSSVLLKIGSSSYYSCSSVLEKARSYIDDTDTITRLLCFQMLD